MRFVQRACFKGKLNHTRLLKPIGNIAPAKTEVNNWRQLASRDAQAASTQTNRTSQFLERFTGGKTGNVFCCKRGMTGVRGGDVTGACLTVLQSLGSRKEPGAGFTTVLQRASRPSMR